jgi:limonene-1,2-epoxide hydrolase
VTRDFDMTRALLDDDVTFRGPLGETVGAEDYIAGVRRLAELVDRADIVQVIADGDDVCLIYDLVTKSAGAIPTVGWYKLREGRITSVRAFFDPRPLLR